ncbi:MAG: hypothetical protein JWR67_3756, partial [Mucilaginibacter sp.]|nr:hypothetical protein [Mucilaginibacter sp.]
MSQELIEFSALIDEQFEMEVFMEEDLDD